MSAVVVEQGVKRVFASVLEWPGWCRSAKTEEEALAALEAYAVRYGEIAEAARLPFDPKRAARFEIIERLKGNATTDFGAPGAIAKAERELLSKREADRFAALLQASWSVLATTAKRTPSVLRKGPRGGGRDRNKMTEHVEEAERSYASALGVKGSKMSQAELRAAIVDALRAQAPLREKGWPPRYAARRIAWHVIDHIWEMRDRAT